MPNPNLHLALKEIAAVVRKYDLAASVTACSISHIASLYEVSPSWSVATMNSDPDKPGYSKVCVRYTDPASYAATMGMFFSLRSQAQRTVENMDRLIGIAGKEGDLAYMEKDEENGEL